MTITKAAAAAATTASQPLPQRRPTSLHHDHKPPPPPIPSTTSCHLHPDLPFTGFCSSCLRDRLSRLPPHTTHHHQPLLRRSKSSSSAHAHPASLLLPHRNSCETTHRTPFPNPHPQQTHRSGTFTHPDPLPKKPNGGLWLAASTLTRKLRGWRKKQEKPQSHDLCVPTFDSHNSKAFPKQEKPERRHLCSGTTFPSDTHNAKAPNFLERASEKKKKKTHLKPWDTQSEVADYHYMGRRSCEIEPRLSLDGRRFSWDGMIPAEEKGIAPPGGALQTREYYAERPRRSVEQSRGALVVELDEGQGSSDPKVIPAVGNEWLLHNGRKLGRESATSVGNELFHNAGNSQMEFGNSNPRRPSRWSKAWSVWGMLPRRGSGDGGERSLTESWREVGRKGHGGRMFRSNSNVSSRHSTDGIGRLRSSNGSKRGEDLVLEHNGHLEEGNGLLRFYLTPMHGNLRGRELRRNGSRSFLRGVLRLR